MDCNMDMLQLMNVYTVTVSWEEEEEEKKIYFTQLGLHMTQIKKKTNKHINISKEFKATR